MKSKFLELYSDIAERVAKLSHAKRLQVGAVIVKDSRILSYGYNGTPAGFDNSCETEVIENGQIKLVTKPIVIHAEQNAICKVASSHDSCNGSTIFVTHAPCVECSKVILQSGIKTVYYKQTYRSTDGIELLKSGGIEVKQL